MSAPAVPTPRPREGFREEAFFNDEAGTTRTWRGLRVNRFATIGRTASAGKPLAALPAGMDLRLTNPLASRARVDVPEVGPQDIQTDEQSYVIFVPPGVLGGTGEVHISLLFAVGLEVVRHGLRTFFEHATDTVLILVPGYEGIKVGVGITKLEIDQIFASVGLAARPWVITTMAGYSTGYRGLNGTINNTLGRKVGAFAGPPKLHTGLRLSRVQTVIYYDCFYRGDEPGGGQNTINAIAGIDAATDRAVRFVIYEVTEGGTPRDSGALRVPIQTLVPVSRLALIDLKSKTANHIALAYARMFDAAIQDNYLTIASAPAVIRELLARPLPTRGTVASHLPLAPWKAGPAGDTTLDIWAEAAPSAVHRLQGVAESLRAQFIAAPEMQWMGWQAGSGLPAAGLAGVGEVIHDSFIPEYGWEFLPG
jgi:hypothetical protein